MTTLKTKLNKQFNEVSQVKACKVRQSLNTLSNPQARRKWGISGEPIFYK